MERKSFWLFIIFLILLSCSGKNDKEKDVISINKNEIELNVQITGSESVKTGNPPLTTSTQPVKSPVQEIAPEETLFFLSGRTELLSLSSSGFIAPEGFSIGDIFVEKFSTVIDREIIKTSRLFFDSLNSDQMIQYIVPSGKEDIVEYCEYFFYDKITIDDYIFGKPEIKEKDSILEMVLLPDFINVTLYFSYVEGKWLINGLEADLRSEIGVDPIGKWSPSINPAQIGNY